MQRVLLIEDNPMNRDMLSRRLERRGFSISVAADGREGLRAASKEAPDLILMDLSLPEIDGWELTRRLKSNPETRGIPILALTAHAMGDDRDKALAAGCDDYDSKPVVFEQLLEKMARLLQGGAIDRTTSSKEEKTS